MAKTYTTDNDEIRTWIEDHDGVPVIIKGVVEDKGESPEMLHVSFGPMSPDMEEMDWDEFFERFENENLALVYDDAEPLVEGTPDFEFTDRDFARAEYSSGAELPDSGDEDVLRENITSDIDTMGLE